jgi:hypothetical protein
MGVCSQPGAKAERWPLYLTPIRADEFELSGQYFDSQRKNAPAMVYMLDVIQPDDVMGALRGRRPDLATSRPVAPDSLRDHPDVRRTEPRG